ncbi:MAG: diaminopimelate epimerase [Luteitalea sp.]|nr:diaminopimelate epimerase [Luteitalea sp.]
MLDLHVTKAHAYGNDFLYVPHAAALTACPDLPALARRLCDRHTGLGADGLILYTRTADGAAMRLLNADGSAAEVSGNGVRGLAALIARTWLAAQDVGALTGRTVAIGTDAGRKLLTLVQVDSEHRFLFRADMGTPQELRTITLDVAGERIEAVQLSMGNPQLVLLAKLDVDRLVRLGAALQSHPACPGGTNFEMVDVVSHQEVQILIYERGVGPTSSSGTGSCAAAVAAATSGGTARDLQVSAPGGAQRVEWRDDTVYLTGWADVLFEGTWFTRRT